MTIWVSHLERWFDATENGLRDFDDRIGNMVIIPHAINLAGTSFDKAAKRYKLDPC